MKDEATINFFLEKLKTIPIVAVACEKSHIARSTVYDWRRDPVFRKKMDAALLEGVAFINDMTESELIGAIRDGKLPAIFYWLSRRNPKFKDRIEVSGRVEENHTLDEKQLKLVVEAQRRNKARENVQ
jgi:hypothetical protein